MKIAFVRGPHLNPWELQSYLPVAQKYNFTAVGADWQFYKNSLVNPALHLKQGRVWGGWLKVFGARAPIAWNRLLSWTLGQSYGLCHFNETVETPDIVHTAETYSTQTYQGLLLKKKTGCRLAVTVWENLPGMGETHPVRKRKKEEVLQNADGFLAVTDTTRRLLISEGVAPERISVIFPAVDLDRFKPSHRDTALAQRLGIEADDLVILFIGRLVPEKGVQELLDAACELLALPQKRRLRFIFAGAGPLFHKLQAARSKWGAAIVLAGFFPYDEVPSLHTLADIFVLPSKAAPKWQEQFGYVLAESMACAKAVVTTRSGSIPDVVGDAVLVIDPGKTTSGRSRKKPCHSPL
jgi:glycosyltransferase involved in cell wall biosynthesis